MKDWPTKKLGDIAVKIFSGKGLTAKQMLSPGHWPCIRNQDLGKLPTHFINCISKVNHRKIDDAIVMVDHGTILMTDMGTEKGLGRAAAYMGHESPIIGNSVVAITHNENPVFLAHALNSQFVRRQVNRAMKGTIVQHLRSKDLKNLEVVLPDRDTQNTVAKVIEAMESNVANASSSFEVYKNLYDELMKNIFSI